MGNSIIKKLAATDIFVIVISFIMGMSVASLSNPFQGYYSPSIDLWYSFNSWLPMILGYIIICFGWTIAHARAEAKINIPKSKKPQRVIIRGAIATILTIIMLAPSGSIRWSTLLWMIPGGWFVFGIFFDPAYNRFRKPRNKWDYTGDEENYGKWLSGKEQIIIEILGAVLCFYLLNRILIKGL